MTNLLRNSQDVTVMQLIDARRLNTEIVRIAWSLRVFCLATGIWACNNHSKIVADETLTAKEVLARSEDAMKPPISYLVSTKGVTFKCSQSQLSQEAIGTRIDFAGDPPTFLIIADDKSYHVFPNKKSTIDTSFLVGFAKSQTEALTGELPGLGFGEPVVTSNNVHIAGRVCIEISRKVSGVEGIIGKYLPTSLSATIPFESKVMIDKETFEVIATESLDRDGKSIASSINSGFDRSAGLAPDQFLPPDGFRVLTPKSVQEYAIAIRDVSKVARQKPLSLEFDPVTGEVKLPVPDGVDKELFRTQVEKRAKSIVEREIKDATPKRGKIEIADSRMHRLPGITSLLIVGVSFFGLLAIWFASRKW